VVPFLIATCLAVDSVAAEDQENPLNRMIPVPADQPIPVIDFFRPWLFTGPTLNPAGTHFAALVSSGSDRRDLAAFEVNTMAIERLSWDDDHDIDRYEWLDDRRLLFSVSREKLYDVGLFTTELGRFRRVFQITNRNGAMVVDLPRGDPGHIVIWVGAWWEGRAAADVLKVRTRGGSEQKAIGISYARDNGLLTDIVRRYPNPAGGEVVRYLADIQGELAFAVTVKEGVATLHRLDGDRWIACPVDLDAITLIAVDDRPGGLLALSPAEKGRPRAIRRLDASTGLFGETLWQDERYDSDAARVYRHPVDGRVLGLHFDRKGPETVWFDAVYEAMQQSLQARFPKDVVHILGSDRAESRFVFSTGSDVRPPGYHVYDQRAGSVRALTSVAPWIDPERMQRMRLITCKTRDGREIEGYVTLPAGASKAAPVPLVVLPHGGPWIRDAWGWNGEVQFLASRGYAVFQPNYRGSTGTTWRFTIEDRWAFRKMHDDVTDGLHAVLQTGYVDRNRVAIMGTSFGGYLALCGAAYEPGVYRCAITIAGVFDWEQLLRDERRTNRSGATYGVLRRNLGDPRVEQAEFEKISPLHSVDRIQIPVFVAHGSEDPIASARQSTLLIAELRKHGVPYQAQIERNEGHGFHVLENRIELYSALEHFLAQHLAPRGGPPQP
jgi:dipeptidyl aminopeptidase/acylaminoacyl peptidase